MRGQERKMKGTLLFVCADNLAAHYIGGFKSLSSALRKCRYCLTTDDDMSSKVLHILLDCQWAQLIKVLRYLYSSLQLKASPVELGMLTKDMLNNCLDLTPGI